MKRYEHPKYPLKEQTVTRKKLLTYRFCIKWEIEVAKSITHTFLLVEKTSK
jgi:hypothetical protein